MQDGIRQDSVSKFWKVLLLLLGFLFIAAILYRHQISHIIHPSNDAPLIYIFHDEVSDDAFYYLKIADNILTNSISSFDSKSVTNGYQPLWLLVLLGLGKAQSIKSTGFMVLLFTTITVLITLGSLFFYRLGGALFSETSLVGTLSYFFSALFLSKSGMEVGLLFVFFPLFFLLLFKVRENSTAANYFWLGIGTSFLLLSRLDIILFFASLAFCIVLLGGKNFTLSIGFSWGKVVPGLAGLTPFFFYMLYNFTNYGNVIPISGQAKALRLEGGISQTGLLSLIETVSSDKVICFFTLVWILSIPIMFLHIRKEADLLRRIAILSIFLYPVVFYIYYLLASDWPFWLWYYYPIIFAFSFGALLIENFVSRRIPILRRYYTKIIAPAFVLLLATAAVILLRSRPVEFIPNPLHDAAIQIKDFSDQHPGIYAMGDRAGIVGFLLNSPLIQLEGIVGNRDLLSKISSQKNLLELFDEYNLDYYIATNPVKAGPCWLLEEPKIPGSDAPRMRGQICSDPIFTYEAVLDDVTTMIFKVNGKNQKP